MPTILDNDAYFTVAAFRARYGTEVESFTPDQIEDARLLAETAYEQKIGFAWVPRTATERSVGVTGGTIQLPHRYVREITAATDRDGNTVTVSGTVYDGSWVYASGGWGTGHPLTVTYTHGKDAPDAVAVNAVMILTKHFLVARNSVAGNSSVDPRVTAVDSENGLIRLSTWPLEVNTAVDMQRVPSVA